MAIATGARYLEHLVRYLDRNAGPLVEGMTTLKINTIGLHYVQSRLEALQELEVLITGAPVDYLRAYLSDLGDNRAIEQLCRMLGLLRSLKVISALQPPARDSTPLSLLPFWPAEDAGAPRLRPLLLRCQGFARATPYSVETHLP